MQDIVIWILVIGVGVFILRRMIPGYFWRHGCALQDRGDYDSSERAFRKALAIEEWLGRVTGRRIGAALIYSSLGFLYKRQQRLQEAINAFSSAISIFKQHRLVERSAPLYGALGEVYRDLGELNLAEDSLNKALEVYSGRNDARSPLNQAGIEHARELLESVLQRRRNTSRE